MVNLCLCEDRLTKCIASLLHLPVVFHCIEIDEITSICLEVLVMNHKDELVFSHDLFHLLPDGLAITRPLTSNRVGELLSDVFAWMDEVNKSQNNGPNTMVAHTRSHFSVNFLNKITLHKTPVMPNCHSSIGYTKHFSMTNPYRNYIRMKHEC